MVGQIMKQTLKAARTMGLLLALAALAVAARFPATAAVPHVFHVSVDGLSALFLTQFMTSNPAAFPNFARLQTEGAFTLNARCDHDVSVTIPNHVCMVTGRPVRQQPGWPDDIHHGYEDNANAGPIHSAGNTAIGYIASTFDVVHDHGLSTAIIASKAKFSLFPESYGPIYGAEDTTGADNGRNKIDYQRITETSSFSILTNDLARHLAGVRPNYAFIHISDPDYAGHWYGWGSFYWSNVVRNVDGYLGLILNLIETSPDLAGQTCLLLTADHGGDIYGGHFNPADPGICNIPVFLWGPGVPAGTNIYSLVTNRTEPASTAPVPYTEEPPCLRNGDTGNLALSLLGLPPIPGSWMRPHLSLPPHNLSTVRLKAARKAGGWQLSWPTNAAGFSLEFTEDLRGNDWQTVTEDVFREGFDYLFQINPANSQNGRFYRLHKY